MTTTPATQSLLNTTGELASGAAASAVKKCTSCTLERGNGAAGDVIYLSTEGGACRFGLTPVSSPFPTLLLRDTSNSKMSQRAPSSRGSGLKSGLLHPDMRDLPLDRCLDTALSRTRLLPLIIPIVSVFVMWTPIKVP